MIKVHELYDQGTAPIPEDIKFNYLNLEHGGVGYAGVADGVSGLYIPSEGPMKFGKVSGGQLAVAVLKNTFSIIEEANVRLAEILAICIPELTDESYASQVAYLPGATFAIAKVDLEPVEIMQCGDCVALWELKDATVGATRNQVYLHAVETRKVIAELMQKHNGDRNKVWAELIPILAEWRRERINNKNVQAGYGLFNGQRELFGCLERRVLSREMLKTLILASDGLFYYPETGDQEALAQKAFTLFHHGGLEAILANTRKLKETEKTSSHIDHAEATALAIEF